MKKICLLVVLSLVFLVSGCADILLSGATAVGYSAVQERSVGNAVDDVTIVTKINAAFLNRVEGQLVTKISVESHEGRVLLTGIVPDFQDRIDAVKIAWQPFGVKEVINEIQVSKSSSFGTSVDDGIITAKAKTQLFTNRDVLSINYSVETVSGVVYLMGVAQDEEELKEVTEIVRHIGGVKKVISHVRLKSDPRRG